MPGMDWDEIEKRLKADALAEELQAQQGRDAKLDRVFEEAAEEAFGGMSFKEYKKAVESNLPGVTDAEVTEAMKIIAEAKKLHEHGKTAAAASKMSHPKVRKVGKAAKKSKGCVIVGLLFLGSSATAVGTLWAAAEVIVRALS